MKNIDLKKVLGKLRKIYSYSPLSHFDDRIIKKFGKTKIDTHVEYVTLNMLTSYYYMYYMGFQIRNLNKETHAKNVLESLDGITSFCSKIPIIRGKGIVEEWYTECEFVREEIISSLQKFLINTKEVSYYEKAMNKMAFYCEKHKYDYEEWKEETNKYLNGMARSRLFEALLLVIGISLGTFCCSKSVEVFGTNSIEELEEYEDTSLEDIDVEQILARKL